MLLLRDTKPLPLQTPTELLVRTSTSSPVAPRPVLMVEMDMLLPAEEPVDVVVVALDRTVDAAVLHGVVEPARLLPPEPASRLLDRKTPTPVLFTGLPDSAVYDIRATA